MSGTLSIIRQSHELANIFPLANADDVGGTRESIIRNGVLEPIVRYQGKILDGRTRKMIVDQLNAEGKLRKVARLDEATGETVVTEEPYTCPEIEFNGTEQEALEYVMARGMHRRHLTSGQKAVVAVRAFLLNKRYVQRARKKGEPLSLLNEELRDIPEGDVAGWIAKVGGTNRTYVFRAMRIAQGKGGNAFLDKVMGGEITLNTALHEVEALEAGDGEEGAGGEEGAPVVLDGLRKAVPEEFHKVFLARGEFKELDQILRDVLTRVERIADSDGGAFVSQTEMLGLVKRLRKELREAQPHTVCPTCAGDGKDPENRREPCPLCQRARFVSKLLYDAHVRERGGLPAESGDDDAAEAPGAEGAGEETDPALTGSGE